MQDIRVGFKLSVRGTMCKGTTLFESFKPSF